MEILAVLGVVIVVICFFAFRSTPQDKAFRETIDKGEFNKEVAYIQSLPAGQRDEAMKQLNEKWKQERQKFDLLGEVRFKIRDVIVQEVSQALLEATYDETNKKIDISLDPIYNNVKEIANNLGASDEQIKESVKQSVSIIIKKEMDNGLLSSETEHTIATLLSHYGVTLNDLPQTTHLQLGKGKTLRNLLEGNVETCFNASNFPFKFQKTESVIWAWGGMAVSTLKTTNQIVGRSHGFSIRLAKGLYYRTGAFGGQRVTSTGLASLGTLPVAVTSKHLYYGGKRIRLEKIVAIEPYADGVTIAMETGRPLCFYTDDPGFFANVLQNAQNWT